VRQGRGHGPRQDNRPGYANELINQYSPESNISFTLNPPLEERLISGITGVKSTRRTNGDYTITTDTPQETLIGIFTAAYENHAVADDVSMRRPLWRTCSSR